MEKHIYINLQNRHRLKSVFTTYSTSITALTDRFIVRARGYLTHIQHPMEKLHLEFIVMHSSISSFPLKERSVPTRRGVAVARGSLIHIDTCA